MAYTIKLTNGNTFANVADGTINTQSSMTLIGKNYAGYGQMVDDNFIHLLENSAYSIAPSAPLIGQIWWDTANGIMKVYSGTTWKVIGSAASSATAPLSPTVGDLWFDTTNQQLKVWSGSAWLLVGPPYASGQGITGAVPATISDTNGNTHVVLEEFVGNTIVAIISQDPIFTPNISIAGFTNISAGYNLASTVGNVYGNSTPYFWGTATNANTLGSSNLTATQFMRSDANTSSTGTVSVLSNNGLSVGNVGQFVANVSSTNSSDIALINTALNGNIDIKVNDGGTSTSAIHIDGSTGNVTIPGLTIGNISGNTSFNGETTFNGNAIFGSNVQIAVSLAVGANSTPNWSGVPGEIRASNNITAFYTSDSRFKENIQDISGALSKVDSIGGKTYDWTDSYIADHGGADGYFVQKSDFGVIAQDVQEVFPLAVRVKPDGTLAVDYEKLAALAFAAVKELNAKVDALIVKLGFKE